MSDYSLIMTSKQSAILEAALRLFAADGYKGTSTSRVAGAAGVSEALIFRHFTNKEGLLRAVIEQGVDRSRAVLQKVISTRAPQECLRQFIQLPFDLPDEDKVYWKLMYKVKWEIEYDHSLGFAEVKDALIKAFAQLDYDQPALEAELLIQFMDGIAGSILRGEHTDFSALHHFLLQKYRLNSDPEKSR